LPARKVVVEVPNARGDNIKWSVHWIQEGENGYTIREHDCDTDLGEAMKIYMRVKAAGRRMPTLRSRNVGFPPPENWQPYYEKVVTKVKRRGRIRRIIDWEERTPMLKANAKGIYWCPYCREMRKFKKQGGFFVDGVFNEDTKAIFCPICGVSHRDWHVRKWNPACHRQYVKETGPKSRRVKRG
jgi:hypothetical protein